MPRLGLDIAAISLCLTVIGVAAQREPTPDVRWNFGHLAEGRTSSTADDTIEAPGYRMFSLPDFGSACTQARSREVRQLRPSSRVLAVKVGAPFSLSSLKIVAIDRFGAVVPQVPIAIETESWANVLDLQNDHIADGTVTPIQPGKTRLRIRTVCPGRVAEAFIDVEITR